MPVRHTSRGFAKRQTIPNIWFDSVEWQAAHAAGIQPIHYVKYIYIYHTIFSDVAKDNSGGN